VLDPHKEAAFETVIEDYLLANGGYIAVSNAAYDKGLAIFPSEAIEFIKQTQPSDWADLERHHGDNTSAFVLKDLVKALDSDHQGTLSVLRHGFKCYGKLLRIAYFAPASGLNPETKRLYDANRLGITRQLHYSPKHSKSLDVVLSLNGIPIATLELKNPMTGQNVGHAIAQYKNDRDPAELLFRFKQRSLVHFAVDTDEVHMTTRLEGQKTRFLPFNKGDGTGKGNPLNPNGHKTAYLWENILSRHSLLDILGQFIHLQVDERVLGGQLVKTETMIFPRYHQLDCVRKMVVHARANGTGHNYLIQHSAGSGKSNSIAWLAHRLSSLYDDHDNRVFDSVVVVTDRVVLDRQLQNTIYQFEHKQGVVEKIDENSAQLAEALVHKVPIIITTLQKFPFVTEKVGQLPKSKYAVIVDEAHSSQSGESATEMKIVLGDIPDSEDEVNRTMLARGRQANLSFFGFTATPKYRTLEIFGQPGPDGKPQPFHLYSMRQAIEEGFILDVLSNYTTYERYYRILKAVADDPKVEKHEAAKALARFVELHPHNIAQKTEVMVEHFRNHTMNLLGGRAKAMVVTSSRLSAVRYKQAFDKYITAKGYDGIKTLVAFSGTVNDPDVEDLEYTEVGMNQGIRETELPGRFGSNDYQVLLVAEKYQTGFDQPLLQTMYVDKKLAGVHAVQTLSRLNRIYPGKEQTFVLDFVNTTEDILEAFKPYYETTIIGDRATPEQLDELKAKLDSDQVYFHTEVEEFAKVFYKPKVRQTAKDHAERNAIIDKAVARFKALDKDVAEEFKRSLIAYRNLYSFLAQIMPYRDPELEKLYAYVRFLITKLPTGQRPNYNFDDEVKLEYYRLEKVADGEALVLSGQGEIDGPTEVGTGKPRPPFIELSELIAILNERFGTNFVGGDQLFFDSIGEDANDVQALKQAALVNSLENFGYVFDKQLESLVIGRMNQNEDITARYLNDAEFRHAVTEHMRKTAYNRFRKAASQ
jgi:type I restriction enzyme R subunit